MIGNFEWGVEQEKVTGLKKGTRRTGMVCGAAVEALRCRDVIHHVRFPR